MKPAVERYSRHVNPALVQLLGVFGYGRVFTRAEGTRLWDDEGREYLDFLAGFGAVNIGHNHPRLVRRLHEFLDGGAVNLNAIGPSPEAAHLAAELAALAPPLERVLFSNSGAEAVEASLKLARAATRRPGIIYAKGAYHGTSLGTLSLMDAPRLREGLDPLLEGCHPVKFGDVGELELTISRDTAAVLVEPIQCEGGVILPPANYLRAARDFCRSRGALFILDEVQTGIGRTGSMFAYETEGITPDVLALAKSLGGGLAPIGATLTTSEIHDRACGATKRFDFHASTFAGNAFATVAALETLRIVRDENLVQNSATLGPHLLDGLRSRLAGHPLVRDIRGRGLLVGIELGPEEEASFKEAQTRVSRAVFGHWAAVKLLERGIVCQPATHRPNVLRLEPPLTVSADEVDRVTEAVADVLGEYRGYTALIADVTARLGAQFLRRWEFR